MMTEPKIEDRAEQPYVAIRAYPTMQQLGDTINQGVGEVAAWLQQQGSAPAGAPFVRYLVIDMERQLEIQVGFPVAQALAGNDRIQPGILPAGRYASLIYTDVSQGIEGNKALLDWGAEQGLVWDRWADENGDAWGGRIETFLTNPDDQPDPSQWETEVAMRLAAI